MSRIKSFNEYHGLMESSFPRVARTLKGDIESISSVGILTACNPMGKADDSGYTKFSDVEKAKYNVYMQSQLKNILREKGYGFHEVEGNYGANESSIIVPNISKELVTHLGIKFNQEAVIWGERKPNENKYVFYYINCNTNEIQDVVEEVFVGNEAQTKEEYYTWVQGRKFYIPFFEEQAKPKAKENIKRFEKPSVYERNPKHRNTKFDMEGVWY